MDARHIALLQERVGPTAYEAFIEAAYLVSGGVYTADRLAELTEIDHRDIIGALERASYETKAANKPIVSDRLRNEAWMLRKLYKLTRIAQDEQIPHGPYPGSKEDREMKTSQKSAARKTAVNKTAAATGISATIKEAFAASAPLPQAAKNEVIVQHGKGGRKGEKAATAPQVTAPIAAPKPVTAPTGTAPKVTGGVKVSKVKVEAAPVPLTPVQVAQEKTCWYSLHPGKQPDSKIECKDQPAKWKISGWCRHPRWLANNHPDLHLCDAHKVEFAGRTTKAVVAL